MDLNSTLLALIPSSTSVTMLLGFFAYLAIAGSIIPGKLVPGVILSDGTRLQYRCNGLISLILLVALLGIGVWTDFTSPTAIADRGLELLSAAFILSFLVTLVLYVAGRKSHDQGSSLKPHVTGNLIHDCWDIIAEKLGFMLVFGDLVWIPFTFSIQGWWLLSNKVELTTAAVIANGIVFLTGYRVFRGANKQKHVFKKNPKAPIWGRPPKVIGGKLLASGYWGIARHCNYLGDLLVASSFSLPCGISSPVPYFYPVYLLILLIWRERRDEARCAEKYREVWAEYCKLVPWRILPYVY
ncbi:delta(14)-sterol reductase isoform X2 [Camellia sinensis]|uniref:delta(14)-sterol reductase isoform X2 n=1 Tax=Camellia sinensis TaxID=4442 RepID=UPI00103608DB|nr:delta(14)-sterol reductase isoform X2 [Camellia sinensis]